MADSIAKFANSQKERWEISLKDEEKRETRFLKFKEEEAKKNREHELAMTQIFATAFSQTRPPAPLFPQQMQQPSWQLAWHQNRITASITTAGTRMLMEMYTKTWPSESTRLPSTRLVY